MTEPAFQDQYPDDVSHCFGCGRLNDHGHQLKSRWDGDETVAWFRPEPYHTATPGFVYGGLIASLVDCHGTATAAAASHRAEGRPMGPDETLRFVTASLHVDFLRPTPLGGPLQVRGQVETLTARKAVVAVSVIADGTVCARGRVVAVRMPETMGATAGPAARIMEDAGS
ncbi:PaaI family thioesterase [Roseospira goensis]|uniref:Acyl-coenzyme A thioesterase THEM4 n=1 Tax=Roseospira goensis TaxID=391922 RepID=A0A7W6WLH6_9PROT|nr:PaaI family thioesterase [Roseospira goensis]MBB4286738.1 acyl-coenzyme A thioesterase PaaI-like protein [Roseospira goensis]